MHPIWEHFSPFQLLPGNQQVLKAMAVALRLLLALAVTVHYAAAGPEYYNPWYIINIATVVSMSDEREQANSSSSVIEDFGERLDVVLVGKDLISDAWNDAADGYAVAANNKILYQTASWSLIEDGTQGGKFSSFWARFQAVNANASFMSMCAMMAEWDSSWKENKAVLSAVDVMDRLDSKCEENDTIALAFNTAVSDNAVRYLQGEIAVNGVISPFMMHKVESSKIPEAADRLFVRLADGLCPRDESAKALSSQMQSEVPLISLFRGEVCAPFFGPKNSQTSNEESDHNDSDWKGDLRFIIPVGACVFVLGCAGLVYLLRRNKKESTKSETAETPKEEDKQDPSSLPYVLSRNSSISDVRSDAAPAGYAAAADDRVLYQRATWALREEGAQYEQVSTFWAIFHVANSSASVSSPLLICFMVVEWEASSWSESNAAQDAVEIVDRVQNNCGKNDTIILAFTSAVTDTVAEYLEGKSAVNDTVAPITLQNVEGFHLLDTEQEASTREFLFVRLGGSTCIGDALAGGPSDSLSSSNSMVMSLYTGDYCNELEQIRPNVSDDDNDPDDSD
ncbi:hypothetical protein L914_20998 [Phytophthora nicotianae]|uniref:Uncharacterized protein n=1 Tax=Phytophthora nicotianae TaxID=4792 RepID=W2M4Z6_PHYNI|nr:hypothetical protein L914_20998 [Phytophthora nicotianae]